MDGMVDPRRIAATARAIADFDVLCLQEVARNFPGPAGSRGEDQIQDRRVDAAASASAPRAHLSAARPSQPPYCCDFVFATSELLTAASRIAVEGTTTASGHQPVVLEL
jgi:endonuclease/exonuclease/phosphatase family metal-dependent hydrolase